MIPNQPADQSARDRALADVPTTGEAVATALDAFLSLAALHAGEALPDGRRLAAPDPMEGWLALLSASALLTQLGTFMSRDAWLPYHVALEHHANGLAQRYPDFPFPLPPGLEGQAALAGASRPLPSLTALLETALEGLDDEPDAPHRSGSAPATGPLTPKPSRPPVKPASSPLLPGALPRPAGATGPGSGPFAPGQPTAPQSRPPKRPGGPGEPS